MKKFYPLIQLPLRVLCVVLLTVLSACDKEADNKEPETPSAGTELVTVKNFSLDGTITYKEAYFLVTDENATVVKEVKFVPGTADLKITAPASYQKSRFNLYAVKIPKDAQYPLQVSGFLQVQNGSEYNEASYNPPGKPGSSDLKINFQNIPAFTRINVSTEEAGTEILSAAGAAAGTNLWYAGQSRLWVQVEKSNGTFYTIFDIAAGTKALNVDLNTVTKKALVKSISAPHNISHAFVWGNPNKSLYNSFSFGNTRAVTATKSLDYYYPAESMERYALFVLMLRNGKWVEVNQVGATIPDAVTDLNADFTVQGKSLADFKLSVSGSFDYYHGAFESKIVGAPATFSITSPSAAAYTDIKLPDLSKYYPAGYTLTYADLKLTSFAIHQIEGFNEKKFVYERYNTNIFLNGKSVVLLP